MKKTYMQPSVEVVKVQTETMIAASDSVSLGGAFSGSASDIQSKERGTRNEADDFGDLW